MPFTSQKQRRLFYALKNKGEMKQSTIDRWNDETKAAQGRGDLPEKLPKYANKEASASVAHKKKIYDVALRKHRPDLLDDERSAAITNLEWMKPRESLGDMKKMLPGSVAVSVHRQVFGGTKKTAAFPPSLTKSLLGAINGAVAGALIGSRRSLDDQTVRGMVQGALTGALAGGAAAQATGSRAAQFAAGGVGGYLASRGPLGPSRPQVHVRLDQNNTGEAPGATEKMMDAAERIHSKLAARTPDAVMKRYARMAQSASKRMTRRGASIGAIGGGALGAAAGALNADLSPRDEATGKKPSMLRGALGGAAIGSALGGGLGALDGMARGKVLVLKTKGSAGDWSKRQIHSKNVIRDEAKNLGTFNASKKRNAGVKDGQRRWKNIYEDASRQRRENWSQENNRQWEEAKKKWDEHSSRSRAGGGWGGWGGDPFGGGSKGSAGGGHTGGGGRSGSRAGGRTADKNPGGYWDKLNIPDNVKRKAKGAAAHAKKTSGPEGDVAKKILRDLANKHGFDYDEAIKTAAELRDMVRSDLNRRRKNAKKGGKRC